MFGAERVNSSLLVYFFIVKTIPILRPDIFNKLVYDKAEVNFAEIK